MQSCAILLTIFYEPVRRDMYAQRIRWWDLHIRSSDQLFVVDSYGASLSHLTRNVMSYDQRQFLRPNMSTTTYEILALRKAYRRWSQEFRNHAYVFKLTGKYVLPSFLPWFHTFSPIGQILLQNQGISNTELIGIASDVFPQVLMHLSRVHKTRGVCMEVALSIIIKREFRVYRMPRHFIPESYRVPRAHGDVLPYL